MKSTKHLLSVFAFAAALVCYQTQAGFRIPYSPDANTTHLWHFDGPTNTLNTTDEVQTASITLVNEAQTQVPGSTITLGNPSITGLGTCLHIIPTNLTAGYTYAFASGGSLTNSTVINQYNGGAFTFEALVKMDVNPFTASLSSENWEIICGDNGNNGSPTRGWQFRISPGPYPTAVINFNACPGYLAADNNISVPLPNSGPDAAVAGQWYHVAVTYTGTSPTNIPPDPANVLTFYWTYLDVNRTNADVLAVTNPPAGFGIVGSVVSSLGVGGSGRANNGVANDEGFKGYIDEARMSSICRSSNDMAFTIGGTLNAPGFSTEPPTNTFLGYGQMLTLPTLVTGTPPIIYQWWQNGGSGYTNIIGQTSSTLVISNVTFASGGSYYLIATNGLGRATSSVSQVSIGAAFSELFNTGVDTNGNLPTGGSGVIDPHYKLVQSGDISILGPATTIWDMDTAPIKANAGHFAGADGASQWIGPDQPATDPTGVYVYQTHFLIDQAVLSSVTLNGSLWVNLSNMDVVLNGVSQGSVTAADKSDPGTFAFTSANGLVQGLNTLEFVTTNNSTFSDAESALRVELAGLGQALPAGKPTIITQPVNQTVRDNEISSGSVATFSVVAMGRPPLTYQWVANGSPISGATYRTLTFNSPDSASSPGTNFTVIVSNASGSVTSSVAKLTLVGSNQPPVVVNYTFGVYSNATLNFDLGQAFGAATDPDGDTLTLAAYDTTTTNGVGLTQNGTVLTYTPPTGYLGADQFSYTISDSLGAMTQGFVNINVLPLVAPSVVRASQAGGNIILTGSGGGAGGSFHVLSSTNLMVPVSSWTTAGAGVFDGYGNLNVTNAITPGTPQNYYIISVP
jgi:hypothetical protein